MEKFDSRFICSRLSNTKSLRTIIIHFVKHCQHNNAKGSIKTEASHSNLSSFWWKKSIAKQNPFLFVCWYLIIQHHFTKMNDNLGIVNTVLNESCIYIFYFLSPFWIETLLRQSITKICKYSVLYVQNQFRFSFLELFHFTI